MRELRDKVAVVTGAASGIGRAMATRFASAGMRVVLADVEEGALAEAAKSLAAEGARVLAVPTDVADPEAVEALADQAAATFGGSHVICNNAGVAVGGLLWECTTDDWEWVLGVNLRGVVNGVRTFVPRFIAQGEGHVVNTASVAGLLNTPMMGVYNVSKHAVVSLTETLARDLKLAETPVGVSLLCPGFVQTRIGDSKRNRPAEFPDGAERIRSEELQATLDKAISEGTSADRVAAAVHDAVVADRFYVLTHPEFTDDIRQRMEDVLAGEGVSPLDSLA